MKKFLFILIAVFTFSLSYSQSESVQKQGNTFVQVSKSKKEKSAPKKTQYTYKTKDGKVYPIYISAKGKCYIIRKSSKTGKEYKQYLPEVTAQLNTK